MGYKSILLNHIQKKLFSRSLLFLLMLTSASLRADEKTAVQDTAVNKTTRTIFKEGAKIVGSNESTWMSIIMIILVLGVVAIALYLSFRSPDSASKRKKVIERQQQRRNEA